jgi:hypothetical protein
MQFKKLITNEELSESITREPEFQNLNKFCHQKIVTNYYMNKNDSKKLKKKKFKSICETFLDLSYNSAYFFKKLVAMEKRSKFESQKILLLLDVEGDSEETRYCMIRMAHEYCNVFENLPESDQVEYLLKKSDLMKTVEVFFYKF